MKGFLLDNDISDFSAMKERIAMLLFGRMGLPAPRETHTRLYINDIYAGVYTVVEAYDKALLRRIYNEDEGYLYEYVHVDGYRFQYLGDNPELYSPVPFKPETHEEKPDPKPLEAMVRTLNQASDSGFDSAAAEYIDLKLFLTHIAVEAYLAEFDGVLSDAGMNNFYLYRFNGRNLSQFIAKDKDLTFTLIDFPVLRNIDANVLMRRALAVPGLREFFSREVLRAAESAGGADGWMDQEIQRIYNQIGDAVRIDGLKECVDGPCSLERSNEEFERTVEYMRRFAAERPEEVVRQLTAAGFPTSSVVQ
jgi:hypothetical protein